MNENTEQNTSKSLTIYLNELIQKETNPLFLRILNSALRSNDILNEMESEMSNYLKEVLTDEN